MDCPAPRVARFRWSSPTYIGEHRACDLCGSAEAIVVGRRDRWLQRLTNVMCTDCGLVRLDPMPTEDETATYYRHVYRLHYQGSLTPKPAVTLRALRVATARVEALAGLIAPGASILDIGASSGEFVHLARRAGFRCEGVEPNIAFARFAAERYGVQLRVGGWDENDADEASFDMVTLHHVLEHLRSPREALLRIHRWIKPGGVLHVAVPDIANPARTPLGRFHMAHTYGFSHQTLVMMALAAGFEPLPQSPAAGTNLVFRRLAEPAPAWRRFPDSAANLRAFFESHTMGRHFLRPRPYQRFFTRWARFLSEHLTVFGERIRRAGQREKR